MQTHFQMGQAPQAMMSGLSHPMNGMSPLPKAWHGASDNGHIRQEIISQIVQLLQKRGVERNLHNVAKELEGALYLDASTKEEYGDLSTLEYRICSLMLRLRKAQSSSQPGPQLGSQSSRAQLPAFSGMLSPGSSTSMLPPGSGGGFFNTSSFGTAVTHDTSGFSRSIMGYNGVMGLSGSGIGQYRPNSAVQSTGSWMVPTPGLNLRNNGISSNVLDVPPNGRSSDFSFSPSSAYQYHGGKISPGGLLNSSAQGISSLSSNLSNMRRGFIGAQSHHQVQSLLQQRLCGTEGQMPHGNYSVEANNVYNAMLGTAVPTNSTSSVLSEQQESQVSQGFPLQTLPTFSVSTESNISSVLPNHQQEKGLTFSNQSNRRMSGDSDTMSITAFAPPMSQCDVLQSHALQSFESQGNQEVNWVENGAEKQCHLQCDVQKSQPSYGQLLYEHACQANSADTGQSEVVSNDEAPSQVKEMGKLQPAQELKRRQWLLILLWHVNRCSDSGSCNVAHCPSGQRMWTHLKSCKKSTCLPKCTYVKAILRHHQNCRNVNCAICGPVRTYLARHTAACKNKMSKRSCKPINHCGIVSTHNEADSIPPLKRMKVDNLHMESMEADGQNDAYCQSTSPKRVSEVQCESPIESSVSQRLEEDVKRDIINDGKVHNTSDVINDGKVHNSNGVINDGKVQSSNDVINDEKMNSSNVKDTTIVKSEISELSETDGKSNIQPTAIVTKVASDTNKIVKTKISGISYVENFSPQLIRQHITSLRKWIGQSRCKAEKNQAMQHHMSPSACSACAVEDLFFDPIPIFCTQCGCRIKRNATYYSSGAGENSSSFCGPCYNSIRNDTVETDGFKVKKSMLLKKKNDETRAEGWVQCDKCKKWQHQICVLFNARMNKERSEYFCPECCIEEMEGGQRVHGTVNSVPGAKDLPSTVLSNYIQERLSLKLHEERMERAQALGKSLEEVPTSEGLVVRVLSSVDKKLDVKPRFSELFQEENYPKDFLYKSKMLMLFQDIEGVEVCLFGMYVQEFGADTPQPNHRWVYLSYLDSVKYFRPDVRTVKGEALRTFVYHEILIGYLDYCKKRGFSSCYIWACPPLKGDDYILYCHPEIQKTPKTDKLREWYLHMISKAKRENIVVANKNLYDYFFTSNGDCKAKITATRLPYFDGDYWPGAAEDLLHQLQQEDEGLDPQKRSKMKKIAPKRTTKTSAQAELGGNVSMDHQLMHKLGQSIVAMKEDFIIVQLHNACSRCRTFIYSGYRWVCHQCSGNFQLCSSCYDEHQTLDDEDKHPAGKKETHCLTEEEVDKIPAETVDKDDIMESEFFDNRQSFLSLCQGNQYQFDTLRRAKHSSMMILYHLHNPNAPAFITSCSVCHSELEAGQGYRCKSCTDFDVCHTCYTSSEDVKRHPHAFVLRSAQADSNSGSANLRKQRMLQMRMMLEVLVHASKCRDASCQFAKCRNMKDLFRHGQLCSKRANGGCPFCKRIWFLLTAHARGCKESVCSVPRCMDLRKHFKRTQLQQESRRRAAVNEMMRQRAAEAAGCQ